MMRKPILPSILRGESESYKQLLAEEGAILNADTSHLDKKRIKERVEHIICETDKAVLVRTGHWRGTTKEAWLPKSQVEFITDGCKFVLIPVWLAKQKGFPVTIETHVYD
jgi:hypothetical protein